MKKLLAVMVSICCIIGLAACGGGDGGTGAGANPDSGAAAPATDSAGTGDAPAQADESGDAAPAGDGSSVTVWAWDANYNIPIMQLAAEYYAEATGTDFSINVVEMSNEDTQNKMVASFTAGSSDGLPDIVLMDDYDAASYLTNYEGKFANLSAQSDIDFGDFAGYKVDAVSYDGDVYAVPFDSGVAGLYYRVDYLEQAGYSEDDMEDITWSEFVQIAKDVKEATGNWFVVFKPDRGTHYVQIAMQSAGVWYFDDDGEIYLKDNAAVREMCEILKELANADVVYPVNYYEAEAVGAINNGEVAAALSAIWFAPSIQAAEDQAGQWAYTTVPVLENTPGATHYSNLGGASWFVLEDAPNKALAIDFLAEVFAGNQEFYQRILEERGAVCTYLPAQQGMAYDKESDFFGGAEIYGDFAGWMEQIPGVSYGVHTNEAVDALRSVLQDFYDDKLDLDEMLEQAENYYHMQVG